MRTHSNSAINLGSQFTDAMRAWGGHGGPASETPDSAALQASLAQEHRDLDDIIAVLSAYSPSDGSLISRMKKRKLYIKDEMARIAGMPELLR